MHGPVSIKLKHCHHFLAQQCASLQNHAVHWSNTLYSHWLDDQVLIPCRTRSSYLRHRKHTSTGTPLPFCPVDDGVKLNVAPPRTYTQNKGKDILVKYHEGKEVAWRYSSTQPGPHQ